MSFRGFVVLFFCLLWLYSVLKKSTHQWKLCVSLSALDKLNIWTWSWLTAWFRADTALIFLTLQFLRVDIKAVDLKLLEEADNINSYFSLSEDLRKHFFFYWHLMTTIKMRSSKILFMSCLLTCFSWTCFFIRIIDMIDTYFTNSRLPRWHHSFKALHSPYLC